MIEEQIELEKKMTQCSIDSYRNELERNKQTGNFGCTSIASKLISRILDGFTTSIKQYLDDYAKGKAVRSTLAADVILRLNDIDTVAYITSKVILINLITQMK